MSVTCDSCEQQLEPMDAFRREEGAIVHVRCPISDGGMAQIQQRPGMESDPSDSEQNLLRRLLIRRTK